MNGFPGISTAEFSRPDLESLRKKHMVVDMHVHSRYSYDSSTPVKSIVEKAYKQGIKVAITDHNRIAGVLEAHKTIRGRRAVIPGIEITTKENKDLLAYFSTPRKLESFYEDVVHPRTKQKNSLRLNKTNLPMFELLEELEASDAVVVLPHPVGVGFKSTYKFFQAPKRQGLLRHIHAIEVINETVQHKDNLQALGWAFSLGKPFTAASDAHQTSRVGQAVTASRAKTTKRFLDEIRHGRTHVAGRELRLNERLSSAWHIVREKARVFNNRKLDKELFSQYESDDGHLMFKK